MSYNFNLATWGSDLNCMKDCKFPVSYSLQSVTMKSPEKDAGGLVSLTLRTPGEIRVVHGNEEFHAAVKKAVSASPESAAASDDTKEKNGSWTWNVAGCDFRDRTGVQLAAKLLEGVVKSGWEVVSSAEFTTTPGFELVTWVFKRSATPIGDGNGAVVALMLTPPNSVEVVGDGGVDEMLLETMGEKYFSGRAETAVTEEQPKEPEKIEEPKIEEPKKEEAKEGEEGPQQDEEGEKKEADDAADGDKKEETEKKEEKKEEKVEEDKPEKKAEVEEKPSITFPTLNIDMNRLNSDTGNTFRSKLVLEMASVLLARQWRLVATAFLPCGGNRSETMFFCKDSRMLPGLGGEGAFAAVEIEKPDVVRFHGASEDAEREVKNAILEAWPPGMESKEPEVVEDTVKQYKLLDSPWVATGRVLENGMKIPSVSPQAVISAVMLALNKCELNLYGRVTLGRQCADQRTLFIFRQSNVTYSEYLTIKLTGRNRLAIVGGTDADLDVIRNCLQSRWPYPLSRDYKVMSGAGHPDWWFFKVKRYPWNVSYGNKHADKAIEATKTLLEKQKVSLPPPSNMDAESAKSLLIFLLKDLGEHGWRLQTMADVSSEPTFKSTRQPLPERPSDPHSIFLLK